MLRGASLESQISSQGGHSCYNRLVKAGNPVATSSHRFEMQWANGSQIRTGEGSCRGLCSKSGLCKMCESFQFQRGREYGTSGCITGKMLGRNHSRSSAFDADYLFASAASNINAGWWWWCDKLSLVITWWLGFSVQSFWEAQTTMSRKVINLRATAGQDRVLHLYDGSRKRQLHKLSTITRTGISLSHMVTEQSESFAS